MRKNFYTSGDHNIICDVCSKKIKMSDARKRWDGFLVCPEDFEERHSQDFVRARQDKISVSETRPRTQDAFRLREVLYDSVVVSDSDFFDDYMLHDANNMYFLEDYLEDIRAFIITMNWQRDFNEDIPITESIGIQSNMPFTDTINITEDIFIGSRYRKTFTDTATIVDSGGDIFHTDYVEASYFSEYYVGTTYTF